MRPSGRSATRNKLHYRFNHWPIWIFVFFIAPGPLTFDLFERGFDARMVAVAGRRCWSAPASRGCAGGCRASSRRRTSSGSPKTNRTRSTGASVTPSRGARRSRSRVLNITGLVVAIVTGHWYLKQIYATAYFPDRRHDLGAGLAGQAAASEAVDQRRGARAAVFLRHRLGHVHRAAGAVADVVRRAEDARGRFDQAGIFLGILALVGNLARLGRLPRTRPIVPGELAVSD